MAESKWLWPVPYTTNITQYYTGAYADGEHSGIDISDTGVSGKAVVASKSGTVSAIYSGCANVNGKSTRVSCSSQTGYTRRSKRDNTLPHRGLRMQTKRARRSFHPGGLRHPPHDTAAKYRIYSCFRAVRQGL